MNKERVVIEKMFLMLQTIYLRKWTDNFTSGDIVEIAMQQWEKGLRGIEAQAIEMAVDYCRINLEWPPSIAEFISICERRSGLPCLEDAFAFAVKRDFAQPVVKAAFDLVGSWAMSHDTEKELRIKFKRAYQESLMAHRNKINSQYKMIEG